MPRSGEGRPWGPLSVFESLGGCPAAEVYRARWIDGDRIVVLRLLAGGPRADVTASRALVERGRAWIALEHPHLVRVLGTAIHDDCAGLWMEFVEGTTLADHLAQRGPLDREELVAVGTSVCDALVALHGAGILHADLRARNVMRARGERLLLLDPSTPFEGAGGTAASTALPPDAPALYAAPERLRGEPPSASSDLYALGVLLHHLATADYPVRGETLLELRQAHERAATRPLAKLRRDLPATFCALVERALAARPADRFASASELMAALSSPIDAVPRASVQPAPHPPLQAPRWTWLVVALALGAGAIGIAPLVHESRDELAGVVPQAGTPDAVDPARAPRLAAQVFRSALPTDEPLGTVAMASPGDQFYLMLEPAEDQVLYVLLRRARGEVIALLPGAVGEPGRRSLGGRRLRVPEMSGGRIVNWTAITAGRQTLLVLGAREPIPLLEAALLGRSEEDPRLPAPLVAPLFEAPDPPEGVARGSFVIEVRAE